jgi:hypothetical protein
MCWLVYREFWFSDLFLVLLLAFGSCDSDSVCFWKFTALGSHFRQHISSIYLFIQPTNTLSNIAACPASHRPPLQPRRESYSSYSARRHFSSPSSAGCSSPVTPIVQSSRPESHTPPTSPPIPRTVTPRTVTPRIVTRARKSYTRPHPHIYVKSSTAFPWQGKNGIDFGPLACFCSVLLVVRCVPMIHDMTSKAQLIHRESATVVEFSGTNHACKILPAMWIYLLTGVLEARLNRETLIPANV